MQNTSGIGETNTKTTIEAKKTEASPPKDAKKGASSVADKASNDVAAVSQDTNSKKEATGQGA